MSPDWLQTYGKWTARVAVVALAALFLIAIAFVPIHQGRGGAGTIWPLSSRFGHRHGIACTEVVVGWIAVGLAALVFAGRGYYRLLRRAGWAKGTRP